jgi:hypothetical protein
MRQKIILGILTIVIVLGGCFAAWRLQQPSPELTRFQTDLQDVEPHFIPQSDGKAGATYTPDEQKIRNDTVALLLAENPSQDAGYYAGLWLDAVGKRYVLATQPSGGSARDEIIDSQTGKVTDIPGDARLYLAAEGRDAALYIDTQAVYAYALDQGNFTLVPGSQLSGNETYHSGMSDSQLAPVQTHTVNSITISVFDSSQIVRNPDAQPNALQTMNKKVRDVTLSF